MLQTSMAKRANLFLNGSFMDCAAFLYEGAFTVAADGGVVNARKNGITPDVVLGDGDSIEPDDIAGLVYINAPDQNYTDFEKSLQFLVSKGFTDIDVFCFSGGRTDHMLSGLSVAAAYRDKARLRIFSGSVVMELLPRSAELKAPVGTRLSLIPYPRADGVTTSGLVWEVEGEMELGALVSISNRTRAASVVLRHTSGSLFLVMDMSVPYTLQATG